MDVNNPQALLAAMRDKLQRARADEQDAALRVAKAHAEVALTDTIAASMRARAFPPAAIEVIVSLEAPEAAALAGTEKKLATAQARRAAAEQAAAMAQHHVDMQANGAAGAWYVGSTQVADTGQKTRGTGRALGDPLKLAGRVDLDPGETFLGSGKVTGMGGTARWAVTTRADGSRSVRLGIGDEAFGTREDDVGPWRACPDDSEQVNAERRKLRDEQAAIEARFGEIEAANWLAEHGNGQTPAELKAEQDRVEARLDEINAEDAKVNAARRRHYAGEQVDEAELNPPRYCKPGEYDTLLKRYKDLRQMPDPAKWSASPPQPEREPGEYKAMERRYGELDDMNTNEIYPSGYTARLDPDAVQTLRREIDRAVEQAEAAHAAGTAYYDEHERLEAVLDSMRGMDRPTTPEEDALWDKTQEALEAHRATEPDMDYQVFGAAMVPGEWGDVHYEVDLDDYGIGPQVAIGVVQHGSGKTLDDLRAQEEASARLDTPVWKKISKALGRATNPGPATTTGKAT